MNHLKISYVVFILEKKLFTERKKDFRTKFQRFVHLTSKEKPIMSSATNTGTRVPNLEEDLYNSGHPKRYQSFNDNRSGQNYAPPVSSSISVGTFTRQSSRCATENLQQSPRILDQQTKFVVDQLKSSIQNKGNQQEIDESFVERELSEIIARRTLQEDDLDKRRRTLPEEFRNCSDDVFKQALIFGCDCRNFDMILKEKIQKEALSPKPLFPNRQTVESLKRTFQTPVPFNLFQAVLSIKGDEIHRAVRMFYSEAQRLVPGLEHYEINDAHEQVQAIRLTHYQSDDKRVLHDLIQYHRTFDEAYSYLQGLAAQDATDYDIQMRCILLQQRQHPYKQHHHTNTDTFEYQKS
ncbi:unnamed protein product [Adineta ricciae]|uniref:Uncharacterized protein n=1 Tax=Adineta ricciae TaxID=249248 RepID=A0A814DD51_ADIRI|nr:unnamed protein product [Adineta ricciae]